MNLNMSYPDTSKFTNEDYSSQLSTEIGQSFCLYCRKELIRIHLDYHNTCKIEIDKFNNLNNSFEDDDFLDELTELHMKH